MAYLVNRLRAFASDVNLRGRHGRRGRILCPMDVVIAHVAAPYDTVGLTILYTV